MSVHENRLRAMLADPDCTGDLLLLGIALARHVDKIAVAETNDNGDAILVRLVAGYFPADSPGGETRIVQQLIRDDVRRYEMPRNGWSQTLCGAPMVRRDGTCGKLAATESRLVDLDTGERASYGACSRPAHREWLRSLARVNREQAERTPPPAPAANRGGVLARHLPEIAWAPLYQWVDPKWTPPPEGHAWRRPTLTLHPGDGAPADDTPPPALTVLSGDGHGLNLTGDPS